MGPTHATEAGSGPPSHPTVGGHKEETAPAETQSGTDNPLEANAGAYFQRLHVKITMVTR